MRAEGVTPQPTLRVDEAPWSASPASRTPPSSGDEAACRIGRVDPDGEADAVLVKKRLERLDLHRLMVLEHGVQSDDRERSPHEQLRDALRLRDPRATQPGHNIWNAWSITTRPRSRRG